MRTRWGVACILFRFRFRSDEYESGSGTPQEQAFRTLNSFTLLLGRGQLRAEFFVLALVAHHFESALGLFIGSRDFRLYLGSSLFHLRREANVAVVLHA